MTKEWRRNVNFGMFGGSSVNYVLNGDGFYISYNEAPPDMGMGFGSDDGGDETALCRDGKYHILNGDFRDAYAGLIDQGFDACFEFFTKQNNVSSWSSKDARTA
jgi:hypothetical protein